VWVFRRKPPLLDLFPLSSTPKNLKSSDVYSHHCKGVLTGVGPLPVPLQPQLQLTHCQSSCCWAKDAQLKVPDWPGADSRSIPLSIGESDDLHVDMTAIATWHHLAHAFPILASSNRILEHLLLSCHKLTTGTYQIIFFPRTTHPVNAPFRAGEAKSNFSSIMSNSQIRVPSLVSPAPCCHLR
jgi:hypothetical protein